MSTEHQEEAERQRLADAQARHDGEAALQAAMHEKEQLQKKVEHVESDLANKAATAEAALKKAAAAEAEVKGVQAAKAEVEASARKAQKEAETILQGVVAEKEKHQEVIKQMEIDRASMAATADTLLKQAAVNEAEMQRLQTEKSAEARRADAAEVACKKHLEEAERSRIAGAQALQQSEAALQAAVCEKEQLHQTAEQVKSELANKAAVAEDALNQARELRQVVERLRKAATRESRAGEVRACEQSSNCRGCTKPSTGAATSGRAIAES
eukprot:TRINITY_DN8399_c0_g1_i17.p1 TRINITY_DN8399_c0_g1~~TRINITY_DN8399_c0_g1_i17.p1  ORF type:complete len:270 (-),score=94.72 TRINITY_DN8399_c0_g1_i17:92-901(-)